MREAIADPGAAALVRASENRPMIFLSRAGEAPARALPSVNPLRDALPASRRALRIGGVPCETGAGEWVATAALECLPAGPFDLVVVGHDVISQAPSPAALLDEIRTRIDEGATLVVDLAPMSPLAVLQRCLDGDFTDDDDGPFGRSLRHASPPSLFKLLLDAGWMPDAVHTSSMPFPQGAAGQALLGMAAARGLPPSTAVRRLSLTRMIVSAQRLFADEPDPIAAEVGAGRFAVIVPTTRDSQYSVDVERSPGLAEVGARIVSVRHAATPGEALERGSELLDEEWVLLCHQDVYFPRGFGRRLQRLLAGIPAVERERTLIGFAGMGANTESGCYVRAGFVIDRWSRFDHAECPHATSMDELALVVARRSMHRIDPSLGWHLWATDLCLSSIARHRRFARIVRLPLLHNSYGDYRLPDDFHASARRLAAKHADGFGPIPTLCGTIGLGGEVTFEPAA